MREQSAALALKLFHLNIFATDRIGGHAMHWCLCATAREGGVGIKDGRAKETNRARKVSMKSNTNKLL